MLSTLGSLVSNCLDRYAHMDVAAEALDKAKQVEKMRALLAALDDSDDGGFDEETWNNEHGNKLGVPGRFKAIFWVYREKDFVFHFNNA